MELVKRKIEVTTDLSRSKGFCDQESAVELYHTTGELTHEELDYKRSPSR